MQLSSCRLSFPGILAVFLTSFVFLKCGSRNLLESLLPGNETPMCVIKGNVQENSETSIIFSVCMSCCCIMDIHQPPGSSLVDFPPLNGLLLQSSGHSSINTGLLQRHTHCDGSCRNSLVHYTSHNILQGGGICNIFESTGLCAKECIFTYFL